jgi:hypothetical protein
LECCGDLPHYLLNLLGNCLPIIWREGAPFLILVDFFGDKFPCFPKSRPITRCLLLYCTVGLNIVNYFFTVYCTVGFKSVNYFFTVLYCYSRSQQCKLFFYCSVQYVDLNSENYFFCMRSLPYPRPSWGF